MADLADVEIALLTVLAAALYPQGAAGPSVTGGPLRLYRGWPVAAALAVDIGASVANVSVFPVPDGARNTTRWGVQTSRGVAQPGVTVAVSGGTVTFGGVPQAGDLAGLRIGRKAYVYAVQPADTARSVTAAIADLARADYACLQADTTLMFAAAPGLQARVGAPAPVVVEWGRQEQAFRISAWTGAPQSRDALGGAIGSALAPIAFLPLADGTAGRLRFQNSVVIDDDRDASVYRRDLIYAVEYATTTSSVEPTMLFGDLDWNGDTYFG